jgi:predicted DNA-binding protein
MQLTIRVPDEQMVRIEQIAKQMGLKKSDVTRMAINKFIEDFSYETSATKPYHRAKYLLGVAESGITDLGQRHREHLIKKIKKEHK